MSEFYQGPNNSAKMKVVTIVLPIIATFFVIWRISWRIWKKVLGLSDYLLILGLCLSICLAGFNLDPYFRWGYGYHKADLPPEIQTAIRPKLCFYLNQVFFKATAGVIKLSIAVIYMGIFRQPVLLSVKLARIANFGLIGIIIAYYTAGTLVSMFQCSPIEKAWIGATEGKCIDNTQFRVANAYINAFTSISLVIMPFPVLLATEHRSKELWQFLGLISIGLAHTGCAVTRVVVLYVPNLGATTDPQWFNTTSNTVAMAEIFTALLVSCIITMRPCFQMFGNLAISTLSSASRTRVATSKSKHNSRVLASTAMASSQKHKGDREGFNKIAVTTEVELEIELQSRDQSTEDLFVPSYLPGSNSGREEPHRAHARA